MMIIYQLVKMFIINMMDIMSSIKSMAMENFNGNPGINIMEIITKMKDRDME